MTKAKAIRVLSNIAKLKSKATNLSKFLFEELIQLLENTKVTTLRNSILEAIGNLAGNPSNCAKMIESGLLLPQLVKILGLIDVKSQDKEVLELQRVLANPLICNLTKLKQHHEQYINIGILPVIVHWAAMETEEGIQEGIFYMKLNNILFKIIILFCFLLIFYFVFLLHYIFYCYN